MAISTTNAISNARHRMANQIHGKAVTISTEVLDRLIRAAKNYLEHNSTQGDDEAVELLRVFGRSLLAEDRLCRHEQMAPQLKTIAEANKVRRAVEMAARRMVS